MERYYMLEFGTSEKVGPHVFVHIAKNPPKPGAVIYTIGEITSRFMFYRFGSGKFSKILWDLYDKNKWYYSTNDVGFSVESYVNRADNL